MARDPARCEETMDCPFREDGSSCMGSIRLFAGLPESARNDLMAHALRSTHPAGSLLVREGDPIESILVVRHGRIKTFHADADGEEYLLDILHDGQAIWHGMFLKENVYRYSVGCLTHVDLCRIRRTDFMRLIGDNREVATSLIQTLGTELVEAEEKIKVLSTREPRRRLAKFLLWRDERCIGPEIHLTLGDIANSVGLRPETVSRALGSFERDGMVQRIGRGKIRVLDHGALRRLCDDA